MMIGRDVAILSLRLEGHTHMMNKLEDKLSRLADQPIIRAIRRGLLKTISVSFAHLNGKNQQRDRAQAFQVLTQEIQYVQTTKRNAVLNRHDDIGMIARGLVSELKYALKRNNKRPMPFHMEYQPKVNIKGEVVGAEALLRWDHPVYGRISPLVIISLCDEADLTTKLGTWVIQHAFTELKGWHEKGYDNITLSINISPRQIQEDDHLVTTLYRCIDKTGIDPSLMELELTENIAIDISDTTRSTFDRINASGMNVSIDDFGMGHSSLLYLCDFHANVIKIDMALIRDIVNDKQKQTIVASIISLCKQLGVSVIAEGVETTEQANLLNQLGCQYFQGFLYSASLSSEKFLAFVNQNGTHGKQVQPA